MNDNEPVVLGNVKKGKTGKPIVVILVFLVIGIVLIFLPTISNYFGEYDMLQLAQNGQLIDFFINHDRYVTKKEPIITTTQTLDNNTPKLINFQTIIEYNNFTLMNFDLKTDKITFTIKTSNTIDFSKSNYNLVLIKNGKEIEKIKLNDEVNGEKILTIDLENKLTDTIEVYGQIKELENDTPTKVEGTETTLSCVLEFNTIEYRFVNNKLISIQDKYNYIYEDEATYLRVYQEYTNINNTLNSLSAQSTIVENQNGFEMTANIDLNTYQFEKNTNNNYYSLNTEKTIINNEMITKGFDCK